MAAGANIGAGAAAVEPEGGGWLICEAHDVVWWQGGATDALRAARAASHETEQASRASGCAR